RIRRNVASRACTRAMPVTTSPRSPSQASEYSSALIATRAFARRFSILRPVVAEAKYTRPPSTTGQTGTTWGVPRASAVATWTIRCRPRNSRCAFRSRMPGRPGADRLPLAEQLAVDLDLRGRPGGGQPRLPEPGPLVPQQPRLELAPRLLEPRRGPLPLEQLHDVESARPLDRPARGAVREREGDRAQGLPERAVGERLRPRERPDLPVGGALPRERARLLALADRGQQRLGPLPGSRLRLLAP